MKKFVQAGQDFENTVGQMGKWYTAISDFRKGQSMQKKPPLFKKLFNAGSVEEEALQLLMHEKKIIECLKKEGGAASLDDCAKECGVSKQECMKVIDKMDNVKVSPHGDVILMDGL